ncbi:uncharacterized protein [Diadema antillarum]|uniref:uncharacterized protein n=1 Tax=Diadema antillarum TaxID=105358 RepID=UPI003A885D15
MSEYQVSELQDMMDVFQVKAEIPDEDNGEERRAEPSQEADTVAHQVNDDDDYKDDSLIPVDETGFIMVAEDESGDGSEIHTIEEDDNQILPSDAADIQAALDGEPQDMSNFSPTMEEATDGDSVTSSSVLFSVLSQGASPTRAQMDAGGLKKRFDCRWCRASFTKKTSLRRHMNLHSGSRPFKCPFCEYNATRRDQLKTHIKTRHTKDSSKHYTFKCPLCSNVFQSQKRMTLHMRSHQWDNFTCDQCHIKFKSANELVLHLKRRHPNPAGNPYVCSVCNHWCQTIYEYVDHIETHPPRPSDAGQSPGSVHGDGLDAFDHSMVTAAATSSSRSVKVSILEQELSKGKMAQSRSRYPSGSSSSSQSHHRAGQRRPATMVSVQSPSSGYHPGPSTPKLPTQSHHSSVLSSLLHGNNAHSSSAGISSSNGPYIVKAVSLQDGRDVLRCPQYPMRNHSPISNSSSSRMPSNVVSPTISRDSHESLDGQSPQLSSNSAMSRSSSTRVADTATQDEVMRCEHCRIIFADSIMYAIHMGCHDWQEPFRCNICAFQCADRYEFMSHITRGLHQKR